MEGDKHPTPDELHEDLHSRIMQRNLKGITSPDPELEEDLLHYCQDPATTDDMILLTVDQYDENLGGWLEVWLKKPASAILDKAIEHERQGNLPAANLLYEMAALKSKNYEAIQSERRTNMMLWKQYTVDSNQPSTYEYHQEHTRKVFNFCQCIKHPRMRER